MGINWEDKTCNICGIGSKPYIVILLSLPDPQVPPELRYSETCLCKKHFDMAGLSPALTHNRELRLVAGLRKEAGLEKAI